MPAGTFETKELDHIIDALHSIRFVRAHYASGEPGAQIIKDIVKALRDSDTRSYQIFGRAIMEAITSETANKKT